MNPSIAVEHGTGSNHQENDDADAFHIPPSELQGVDGVSFQKPNDRLRIG